MDAQLGGGGGYTYTGAQTSHWMSCKTCHETESPPVPVEIQSEPEGLLDMGYEPDVQYILHVSLTDEKLGLEHNGGCIDEDSACNRNGMAMEFLVAGDKPAGILCPSKNDMEDGVCTTATGKAGSLVNEGTALIGQTLEFPNICSGNNDPSAPADDENCVDVQALFAEGLTQEEVEAKIAAEVRGRTSWTISWKAPPKGTGYVGLFMGVVDGNGGRTYDPYYSDYVNDGVSILRYELPERGDSGAAVPWVDQFAGAKLEDNKSCAFSQHTKPRPLEITFVFLALSLMVWRRRCNV